MYIYSNRSESSKAPASQSVPQAQAPAPAQTSWASLFSNSSSSSNSESKRIPVAKVSPYNSSQEPKPSNPPLRTTTSTQSTTNAPGKLT